MQIGHIRKSWAHIDNMALHQAVTRVFHKLETRVPPCTAAFESPAPPSDTSQTATASVAASVRSVHEHVAYTIALFAQLIDALNTATASDEYTRLLQVGGATPNNCNHTPRNRTSAVGTRNSGATSACGRTCGTHWGSASSRRS